MLRVLIKRFDAERTAKGDHPRPSFDVSEPTSLIDGLTTNNAEVIPIFYVSIL